MGLENCKVRHFLAIIRSWNKVIKMNPARLTKQIFIWDYYLCKNWCKEVKLIFELIECQEMFTNKLACNLTTETISVKICKMCRMEKFVIHQTNAENIFKI